MGKEGFANISKLKITAFQLRFFYKWAVPKIGVFDTRRQIVVLIAHYANQPRWLPENTWYVSGIRKKSAAHYSDEPCTVCYRVCHRFSASEKMLHMNIGTRLIGNWIEIGLTNLLKSSYKSKERSGERTKPAMKSTV